MPTESLRGSAKYDVEYDIDDQARPSVQVSKEPGALSGDHLGRESLKLSIIFRSSCERACGLLRKDGLWAAYSGRRANSAEVTRMLTVPGAHIVALYSSLSRIEGLVAFWFC